GATIQRASAGRPRRGRRPGSPATDPSRRGRPMAAHRTDLRAGPGSGPLPADPLARRGRPLAVATAVVFLISSAVPVVAGLSRDTTSFPGWWGALDVGIALVLAALAVAVMAFAQGRVDRRAEDTCYRAYRVLIHGLWLMLVVFFLLGDRVIWVNCLTGFAWR